MNLHLCVARTPFADEVIAGLVGFPFRSHFHDLELWRGSYGWHLQAPGHRGSDIVQVSLPEFIEALKEVL